MYKRDAIKRKAKGGVLATLGYLLSPLSWWNDAFINLPIAYAFAYLAAYISKDLFLPALVIGYWISNIFGLILLHRGASDVLSEKGRKGNWHSKKDLLRDFQVSIFYTIIVVILVTKGVLKVPFHLP